MSTRSFKIDQFNLRFDRFTFDNWGVLPQAGYSARPCLKSRLGDVLPEDWDESYKATYRQEFQPSRFYRNAALLTNLAARDQAEREGAAVLYGQLRDQLEVFSTTYLGGRYVLNNFDFKRHGHTLTSGWTGAIMNAFAIAGLLKAQQSFPSVRNLELAKELSHAFLTIHKPGGESSLAHWISYSDARDYLWFEEYPLPNGQGCRVQNGHNFSIFALALYFHHTGDQTIRPLIDGGLTTIKANGLRFRVPGHVPRYSLMPSSRDDYAPVRAVKQCGQLFSLTGDEFFRGLAYIFKQDLVDAGFSDIPEWATEGLRAE